MSKKENSKHSINLDNYRFNRNRPSRAQDASSAYTIRRYSSGNAYIHDQGNPEDEQSAIAKGVAIVGGLILLPLLIVTPFVIAITLGKHFPL